MITISITIVIKAIKGEAASKTEEGGAKVAGAITEAATMKIPVEIGQMMVASIVVGVEAEVGVGGTRIEMMGGLMVEGGEAGEEEGTAEGALMEEEGVSIHRYFT